MNRLSESKLCLSVPNNHCPEASSASLAKSKKFYGTSHFLPITFLLCIIILCTACGTDKIEEVSQEQFLEITEPEHMEVIRQLTDPSAILEYSENEEIEKWDNIPSLPEDAIPLYIFTSYAKVTEPAFQKDGMPQIVIGEEILYQGPDAFYIEERTLPDDSLSTLYYQIPDKTGKYLQSLAKKEGEIRDKKEFFVSWGIQEDITELQRTPSPEESAIQETPLPTNRPLADLPPFRAEDLAKVSKKQRLEITVPSQDTPVIITDLEEIADFYNHLEMPQWTEVSSLPSDSQEQCTILRYQQNRKTASHELIETEHLTLYQFEDTYYLHSTIPPITSETPSMESYYQIPSGAAKYLEDFIKPVN